MIVGRYTLSTASGNETFAFVDKNGTITPLAPQGATGSVATGIINLPIIIAMMDGIC